MRKILLHLWHEKSPQVRSLSSSVSVVDIFGCLILSAFLDQTLFLKECYTVLQNRIVPEWE